MSRRAFALASAIGLLAGPIAADADPLPRVRLSYRAPGDCPDEAAFVASVAAQAHPFERAPRSAARVRSLEAAITRTEAGHTGVLRVREAGGETSQRDVTGATCADVAGALALVAAITIDTGPSPPDPPPPSPPPPEPERARWRWSSAVHSGAFFSMAPVTSWGVSPLLEAVPPAAGTPIALRLGLEIAASPPAETAAGSAEFFWVAARLGVSAFGLVRGPFALRPTAGVGAGFVRGRGIAIANPRVQMRPWVDAALGARAELALSPAVGLELSGGMLVPITRPTWVFEVPPVVIHETPPLGGYLTLGVRFTLAK